MPPTEPLILHPEPGDAPMRVGLVVSRYNEWITARLRDGAVAEFQKRAPDGYLVEATVPGALEIPAAAGAFLNTEALDAVVCLGCVIRGDTDHDRYINHAIFNALTDLAAQRGVPVGIGVLTVNDADQAEARAGGPLGNKGAEAMAAAFEAGATINAIRRTL